MPHSSPKSRLIRAAEAVVAAFRAGLAPLVLVPLIVDLEEAIGGAQPKSFDPGAMLNDPEYYAQIGARGGRIGGRATGPRKQAAGREGGLAGRGVKKPRTPRGGPWNCPCGQRVRAIAGVHTKRIGGFVRERPVSWAECPHCHEPVGPFVYDEDLEV